MQNWKLLPSWAGTAAVARNGLCWAKKKQLDTACASLLLPCVTAADRSMLLPTDAEGLSYL
jgi:hypothetical protein